MGLLCLLSGHTLQRDSFSAAVRKEDIPPCDKASYYCTRCQKTFSGRGASCDLGPPQHDETSCKLYRVCRVCGGSEPLNREEHRFEGWKQEPGRCLEKRRCARCGREETRVLEDRFGPPEYGEEASCELYHVCQVCGLRVRLKRVEHQFGEWEQAARECRRKRRCLRCGYAEESRLDHRYGAWGKASVCVKTRECEVCGRIDTAEEHDFETIASRSEVHSATCQIHEHEEKCRRCGELRTFGYPVFTDY